MPQYLERLTQIFNQLEGENPRMPPTLLYNEGWMLRLMLDAGERGLWPSFMDNASAWYSEAQLLTPFSRDRGPHFESNTHADAVIGDFQMIADTKSGLELQQDAKRFQVLEAKMYSPLSSGTKHAPGYDQAARTVACMAHTLHRAQVNPQDLKSVGFFVVAPESQIQGGIFKAAMTVDSIHSRIQERMRQFMGPASDALSHWWTKSAEPLLKTLAQSGQLDCISWESIIGEISTRDAFEGGILSDFYDKCKQHNLVVAHNDAMAGRPQKGREYFIGSTNQRVRVCSVGKIHSRVYPLQELCDSFLVPNSDLKEIADADRSPAPCALTTNQNYWWQRIDHERIQVRVLNVGDCNSRVIRADDSGISFKVPNHQLRSVE